MWLIDGTPALFTDLYELTMAQVYFKKRMAQTACFEVTVRRLPEHWGFFIMAGLAEVQSYLEALRFDDRDIAYLESTGTFEAEFLDALRDFEPHVQIRTLPEGTVFFPGEPILEVSGPIIAAQLLESYVLNILGFSIIEATLAARMTLAAGDVPVIDFGLRRCQGPTASLRAARAAQMASFVGTSNVFAARALDFPSSGTMAHSFVEVHDSEEQAFRDFAEQYGRKAVLLVDTYDPIEGIKIAAKVTRQYRERTGIEINGIRLDSGDLVAQSRFARDYFRSQGLDFLKVFVSGDLDEYKIHDLLHAGAAFDGFGVGTRFSTARHCPAIEIVYKIVRYGDKDLAKTSPDKHTIPGRKSILRIGDAEFEKDTVRPLDPKADDLLRPFGAAEPIETIQQRLRGQVTALPAPVKVVRNPAAYRVDFADFPSSRQ